MADIVSSAGNILAFMFLTAIMASLTAYRTRKLLNKYNNRYHDIEKNEPITKEIIQQTKSYYAYKLVFWAETLMILVFFFLGIIIFALDSFNGKIFDLNASYLILMLLISLHALFEYFYGSLPSMISKYIEKTKSKSEIIP